MAASKEYFEYHLTPNGWVAGSEVHDFGPGVNRSIPDDRVLSVSYAEIIASPFSKLETYMTVIFQSDDALKVEELCSKYGSEPR